MASAVDICNKAMILLGASQIGSLSAPSSPNSRALALAYPMIRDSELRKRRWRFAKLTENLAQDTTWTGTQPRRYRYQLHAATVRTILEKGSDWVAQGGYIYTDCNETTLNPEVIRSDISTSLYDPLFVDVLSGRIAWDLAEQITQSNTKKNEAKLFYRDAIAEAGRMNAFETGPEEMPTSSWAQQLGG